MKNIGDEFINGTRYPNFSTVDMILRVPEPPRELPIPEGSEVIRLPNPKRIKVPDKSVRNVIEEWEPVGYLARSTITQKELSYLLWCSQGYRNMINEKIEVRSIPSSKFRNPLETYFVAGEVEDLPTGLYRFIPSTHSIVPIKVGSDLPFALGTASMSFIIPRAAVTFLWVGIPYRSVWAMGDRGYRCALIEAGHACQALIMSAGAMEFQVYPLDLFNDEKVAQLAELDQENQWPLYIAAVGKIDREWGFGGGPPVY